MNKIDRDACDNYWSMVDYGDDRSDKEIEKDASWKALHNQIPRMPSETYRNQRAHLTDRRDAARAYVKGFNFKNESRHMNKKPTKFREPSRHLSQNELPPIDKFHPDWWYYRQEMEEPVEIDDNYKNESRHINKKLIRLTESDLHRIVKESVNRVIKESDGGIDPSQIDFGLGSAQFDPRYKGVIRAVRNLVNELEAVGADSDLIERANSIEWEFVDSYGNNGITNDMLR